MKVPNLNQIIVIAVVAVAALAVVFRVPKIRAMVTGEEVEA